MNRVDHNRFQLWADSYARACKGVTHVEPKGNWVEVYFDSGNSYTCMTVQGVYLACEDQ